MKVKKSKTVKVEGSAKLSSAKTEEDKAFEAFMKDVEKAESIQDEDRKLMMKNLGFH